MTNPKSKRKPRTTLASIERAINNECEKLAEIRSSECYPLLLGGDSIRNSLVDRVYDELRARKYSGKSLDVIIDSSGGHIDSAYNLAQLFRRYGEENLTFIVPRWAKSAATLLICAGDEILMTPVAELGPLDPQITVMDPLEQRVEEFSPLHIESTLQLIRDEFKNGNSRLAEGLLQRLQFPLTLGSFKKSLDLGRDYVQKLLSTRMLTEQDEVVEKIARVLTTGYADHSWCITIGETQELGLNTSELEGDSLEIVWKIHKLNKEKEALIHKQREEKMKEQLKDLPPELLDHLHSGLQRTKPKKQAGPELSNRDMRKPIESNRV